MCAAAIIGERALSLDRSTGCIGNWGQQSDGNTDNELQLSPQPISVCIHTHSMHLQNSPIH